MVVGIFGFVHQVAVRSDGPPRTDDTICQDGTFSFDGLEISFTPVDKVDWTTSVLGDLVARLLIRSCTSAVSAVAGDLQVVWICNHTRVLRRLQDLD